MSQRAVPKAATTRDRRGFRIVPQLSPESWALQEMLRHSRLTLAELERREHPTAVEMVAHLERYGWDDVCLTTVLDELKALSA